MNQEDIDLKLTRKAHRRAVVCGTLAWIIISYFIQLMLILNLGYTEPIKDCFTYPLVLSLFFSGFGALAGKIGGNLRHVYSGAAISGIFFCFFGFIVGANYAYSSEAFMFNSSGSSLLMIPVISCAFAVVGSICGGIGAMFSQTCLDYDGKRFWPQFTMAELMMFVFLIAILMSCIVTIMKYAGPKVH